MPPKKQPIAQKSASPTIPTSRKNPDNVRFIKFRCVPKPIWLLRSGNSLTVLRDRIRTYIWDPDTLDATKAVATAQAASNTKKRDDKEKDKDKIPVEIRLKDIDQVDITSTAAPNEKMIVIHTTKPILSAKNHNLSKSLYFFFSALSNKDIPGGQGGLEDYVKMWKSLESRGMDVVTASSANATSDAEDMDEDGDDDGEDYRSDSDKDEEAGKPIISPAMATRKKAKKDASPIDASPPLFPHEGRVPSSQQHQQQHNTNRAPHTGSEMTSEGEDECEFGRSLERKEIEGRKRKREIDPVMQKPGVKKLASCLDEISGTVIKNFVATTDKVKSDRKRSKAKLWRQVRHGLEKTERESLVVAGRLTKHEGAFNMHGKEFRVKINEGKKDMTFFITQLNKSSEKLSKQRQRLLQLTAPFRIQ